ncbi:MAG: methyl-accepting chemotaxis protein [Steroidobacteraceae bacterium]
MQGSKWWHRFTRRTNASADVAGEARTEVTALEQELATLRAENSFLRSLTGNLELFSQSLETTQQSLAGMAATLHAERERAQQAAGTSESGRSAVQDMSVNLDHLAQESGDSARQVSELDEGANRIVGVVETIRDLANRIKLLSLNAAVEAARAGEHGRGFAVVAAEVRSLSEHSGTATREIGELAGRIRDITGSASTRVAALATGARRHSDHGRDLMGQMQSVMDISLHLERVIDASSLRAFVELAKLDHLVFKFKVYRALLGQTQTRATELASHRHCRLGKWYYEGDGLKHFSRLPGYRELEQPHELVHRAAHESLQLFAAEGCTEAVSRAVEQMELASLAVLRNLERMADCAERGQKDAAAPAVSAAA